jgi:hypothetical protein
MTKGGSRQAPINTAANCLEEWTHTMWGTTISGVRSQSEAPSIAGSTSSLAARELRLMFSPVDCPGALEAAIKH